MKILSEIPFALQGRGHNACVPMECECHSVFLFPLSDGTKQEHHADEDTTVVTCPTCRTEAIFTFGDLTPHNGQAK